MIVVAASGGFDPLHGGHVEYLELARRLGDKLVVILNNDEFLLKKKGYVFMDYWQRKKVLESLRCVDEVFDSVDEDLTVCRSLEQLAPDIFAKGGDRYKEEIPEKKICDSLGIKIVDGLGEKVESSSSLFKNMKEELLDGRDPPPEV